MNGGGVGVPLLLRKGVASVFGGSSSGFPWDDSRPLETGGTAAILGIGTCGKYAFVCSISIIVNQTSSLCCVPPLTLIEVTGNMTEVIHMAVGIVCEIHQHGKIELVTISDFVFHASLSRNPIER
jgi:hypothetical protein